MLDLIVYSMAAPTGVVELDVSTVEELTRHLSSFRHDVNGCLSLIVAATELIRYNPDVVKRMATTLIEQPPRIAGKTREFVEECERVLGIRPSSEPSWYRDLWKRHNVGPGEPQGSVTLTPDAAKALHTELLSLGKELVQMSFIVVGANSLVKAGDGAEAAQTAADQLAKVSKRYDQCLTAVEKSLHLVTPVPKRLISGAPSGPVSLDSDRIAAFHRRLLDLEREITELLRPLIDLSRLARSTPDDVQKRAAEFAQQPPKISAEVSQFATEFDSAFHIVRATS